MLRANEDCSALLTLNTGDDTVSLIDTADDGVTNLAVRMGMNRMMVAPGSRYALAYHKFTENDFTTQGYGEISIVDTSSKTVRSLAVGFPADGVVFTDDNRALLYSEITLALVGLVDGSFTSLPTGLDIEDGQKLRKLLITADGDHAFLFAEASTSLLALDLATETLDEIELNCYPTDLEVAETGDVTLLVCREESLITVLDNDTLTLVQYETDEVIGSGELTSSGDMAVLFTNSQPIEKVHLFYTATGELETYLTVKPLIGAAIAPLNRGAILFHFGGDNDPIDDFDRYFDTKEAFSIMNLDDGRINPVEVPATPLLVSFGEDGRHGLIPFPDYRQTMLVDLVNGLADPIVSPSTPIDVGEIVDLGMVYILQEHPLGRISFYDLATRQVRTITGFLLNGEIEE